MATSVTNRPHWVVCQMQYPLTMATAPSIDLLDPAAFDGGQPHDAFAWLRDNDPIHWHEEPNGPGFWVVTRYEDVKVVGRDATTFSSAHGIMIPDVAGPLGEGQTAPRMMISMDAPDHKHYRRLAVPDFIPKAVKEMAPRIGVLAAQIIDGVIEEGRVRSRHRHRRAHALLRDRRDARHPARRRSRSLRPDRDDPQHPGP